MKINFLNNSRGQVLLENVLLTVMLLVIFNSTMKYIRNQEWMTKMANTPWKKLAGMIESGVWDQQTQARSQHPNHLNRNYSLRKN